MFHFRYTLKMEQIIMQLVVKIDRGIDSEIHNIINYKYFNIRKLQNSDIMKSHNGIDSETDNEIHIKK